MRCAHILRALSSVQKYNTILFMHFDIIDTLYSLPGIVIGLTLHEYCHALAAYKLGDGTAKADGRLTFEPLKHIDPIGFLFIVIAGFGWAKPVSFDERNFAHPRRDRILIALAGPLSNLVLGIVSLYVVKLLRLAGVQTSSLPLFAVYKTVFYVLLYTATINLGLFIFNILPIPPLDGSHVFFSGMNFSKEKEARFMQWGTFALFALIAAERATGIDFIPIGAFIEKVVSLVL